jgi:hypothetical protein
VICVKEDRIIKSRVIHNDGGIDLKKIILASLILVAIVGLSGAQAPVKYVNQVYPWPYVADITKNMSFSFDQTVSGTGFYVTYAYVKMGNLAMNNYAHGSGSLASETILTAYHDNRTAHPWALDWVDKDVNCIQFKEDVQATYTPLKMAVGNGYYAQRGHEVDYSTLIKENTWVKNYRAGSSMQHEVEYAHGMDKELEVTAKENSTWIYDPIYNGVGYTNMKIKEHVDNGKVHLGVLQADIDNAYAYGGSDLTSIKGPAGSKGYNAWKYPSIEVDEDYWGTYDIEKNMTLYVPYKSVVIADDWLPCCSGGYLTMPKWYQMGTKGFGSNVKDLFDCTKNTCPVWDGKSQCPETVELTPIKVGKY